ncbi:MAG: hypothetical protein ACFFFG_02990 [Candidatus Thorarchaeota archaeon]
MSFVNELFDRLKKSTTANEVQAALAALEGIQDPNSRSRAAQETVDLISKYGRELSERGQYKNAAYQFYSGAQLIQNFLTDPEAEKQWLRSAAAALAKASQDHIQWDDLLGGAACMTISSLLRLQTGDWNVSQHLDAFVKGHDFSSDQAATACLYIPYDLAGAVNPENPNPSLLQRASGYTENYLLQTKPAIMFSEGIKQAIEVTRQKLIDVVKFPSIRAQFEFDHDVIFGEEFKFLVKLENVGDGIATNVSAHLSIPQKVTVVAGVETISVGQLNPGANSQAEFTLLCSSGEGQAEIALEVPITVVYEDILLNKNSLSLGAAMISIRSEKQAQRLFSQFNPLKTGIMEKTAPLRTAITPDVHPIVGSLDAIIENIVSSTEADIINGDFVAASLGINQLEKIESFIEPLVSFLQTYDGQVQTLLNSFKELDETTSSLVQSLENAEKLLDD